MKLLVIGGAGYVGSHFVHCALKDGHDCVVLDNLSRGHEWAVPKDARLVRADVRDESVLDRTIADFDPDVVLHYAAFALVGESVEKPQLYWDNNVGGMIALIETLRKKPRPIVFSSTCAVYGVPESLPITEDLPKRPISPYGQTKLECERLLEAYAAETGVGVFSLRYFNAAGASPEAGLGEDHEPETHLIPNACKALLEDREVTIFGGDWPSRDGTCIRDYIHVLDLARAHLLAAARLVKGASGFEALNLGTGRGFTNLEVLQAIERAAGRQLRYVIGPRRPGDPVELVADPGRARAVLGFVAEHDLDAIARSAWSWHARR